MAPAIAQTVVDSDALAVVGPKTTKMGLAVLPLYAEAGLGSIGSTARGDTLVQNASFFRASFTTSDTGAAMADYLHHVLHVPRAIVLVKNEPSRRQLEAGFARAAARLGLQAPSLASIRWEAEQAAQWAAAQPGAPAIVLAMVDEAVPVVRVLRCAGAQGPILTTALSVQALQEGYADEP